MSLFGMMRTSVSGLAAQSGRLATVADNIANAGTIGYKRSAIEFSTQVLDSNTGTYNSGSVSTVVRSEISRQGPVRSSTSPTDLAISGSGFFVVENSAGDNFLTRAGSFQLADDGSLVNAAGYKLLGYDLTTTGAPPVANGFGGLTAVNAGVLELSAEPTTDAQLLPNLPSNAAVVAAGSLPSDNVAGAEFSGKTSLLLYDNLGDERQVDVYFAKTATDEWEVAVYDTADATNGGFPYASAALATSTITFDPSSGRDITGGPTTLNFTVPGGAVAELDMTGISQLSSDYQVIAAKANGNAPGSIDRVEISTDGTVFGIYQNGEAIPISQIALAKVPSPDNLNNLPGNAFAVTVDSGDVLVGVAETDGFGSIQSGALEESNVDLSTELTIMIESQRSYTANSRVFQTGSELLDVLINL
ncbi:MAG: flagellar hook protein FlgE [Rhizobiaceae bacterium]|jgi:flagellar hook protein FlgE|nr:flagellar hook protein FlgE [Rhizobiaceae bacterium]